MNYQTTLVTAYYFVSSSSTPKHEYVSRGERTLRIHQPMIIFCEQETKDHILKIRSQFNLQHITYIITLPYQHLLFYHYRNRIEQNREIYWPTRDPRAPTDVHVICVSKFDFIQRALLLNPFQTPYMAWIDFSLLGKTMNNSQNYINDDIYDKITRKTNIVKDIQKMSLKRIVVKELVNRGKGNSLDDLAETVKEYLYEITKMMVEGFLLTNKVIFFNF